MLRPNGLPISGVPPGSERRWARNHARKSARSRGATRVRCMGGLGGHRRARLATRPLINCPDDQTGRPTRHAAVTRGSCPSHRACRPTRHAAAKRGGCRNMGRAERGMRLPSAASAPTTERAERQSIQPRWLTDSFLMPRSKPARPTACPSAAPPLIDRECGRAATRFQKSEDLGDAQRRRLHGRVGRWLG
jgi:hypothetical protein